MIIDVRPEFGYDLVCAAPYAYWLHERGELEKIITCKGMKPFYYFCDDVEERYVQRSVNNQANGVQNLPNQWIHHNAAVVFGKDLSEMTAEEQYEANGVLDYRQWIAPNYASKFSDTFDKILTLPYIVINNNFNIESNNDISKSLRYFDIEVLYKMFNYLTNKGYTVVYKRPDNTEFAIDENEQMTLAQNLSLTADTEQVGKITDYDLCDHYPNVYNFKDLVKNSDISYNEMQLSIFADAHGFITPNGGGGILCGYFGKPVVMHVPSGKETRTNYLTNKDCYYNKLSDNTLYPVIDKNNSTNYEKLLTKIKKVF